MDLFSERADRLADQDAPLAARMRPRTLEEFVGQGQVLGPGSALRALIEADELRSVILWGPAGTCLLYTSPSPRDRQKSRMPSSA